MNIDLINKVVLVTGSSRGIGKELVRAFANENSKVIINYNNSENEAQLLYDEIIKNNNECILIKADITKPDEVKNMCKQVMTKFGKIDILINNAGICDDNLLQLMPIEQWNAVLNVNLTGTYLCCRTFSKIMIKQGYGKIINIASLKGQEGSTGQVNYCTSKAGLVGFTKSLAKELGKYNILVNAVCPGFITTDLNRHDEIKKKIAINKSILPIKYALNDLINFILYMSSDKFLGVSGRTFNIDSRL